MAQVFISYAREDQRIAARLAEALSRVGCTVWWDRDIPAGKAFDRVIEDALSAAQAVLVLWSAHGVESRWVRAEAGAALQRGIIVPALLDDALPPLAFSRIHAQDLSDWDGQPDHPGFALLVRDIRAVVAGDGAGGPPMSTPARAIQPPHRAKGGRWAGALGLAVVAALLAWFSLRGDPGPDAFVGTWRGSVTYSWGVTVEETFALQQRGSAIHGTASFLEGVRGLTDPAIEDGELHFDLLWTQYFGDQVATVRNHYRLRPSGAQMSVLITDDRGSPPVEFTASRDEEAAAPGE